MPWIPWGDHRGGRLEMAPVACRAPSTDPSADPPRDGEECLGIEAGDFHVPLHNLAGFVASLYEAAGLPQPVILPRPQIPGDTSIFLGGYSVRRDGNAVTILVGPEERRLAPAEARQYAAAIAERADEADAAPDAALVAAVTQLAREALRARWVTPEGAGAVPEQVARAILARYTLTEKP